MDSSSGGSGSGGLAGEPQQDQDAALWLHAGLTTSCWWLGGSWGRSRSGTSAKRVRGSLMNSRCACPMVQRHQQALSCYRAGRGECGSHRFCLQGPGWHAPHLHPSYTARNAQVPACR